MANLYRRGGLLDGGEERRILGTSTRRKHFANRLGDKAPVGVADAFRGQLHRGGYDVLVTRAECVGGGNELLDVVRVEQLTAGGFWRIHAEVRVRQQLLYDRHVGPSRARQLPIDVVRKVGSQRPGDAVDHGHAWSGIERTDSVDLAVRRDDGDVADTPEILQPAPIARRREQHCVGDGNQRRPLTIGGDIAHAKIADDIDAGALGDDGRFARLPGRVAGLVPYRLPVRGDGADV